MEEHVRIIASEQGMAKGIVTLAMDQEILERLSYNIDHHILSRLLQPRLFVFDWINFFRATNIS